MNNHLVRLGPQGRHRPEVTPTLSVRPPHGVAHLQQPGLLGAAAWTVASVDTGRDGVVPLGMILLHLGFEGVLTARTEALVRARRVVTDLADPLAAAKLGQPEQIDLRRFHRVAPPTDELDLPVTAHLDYFPDTGQIAQHVVRANLDRDLQGLLLSCSVVSIVRVLTFQGWM
jgi:hypothetical protein